MKRALALTFAALLFGVAGLAQISGSWSGTLTLLPPPITLSTDLSLTYTVADFDITGEFEFDDTGFTSAEFTVQGALGPFEVSGSLAFDPTVPAYSHGEFSSSLDFAGVAVEVSVVHGVYPYAEGEIWIYVPGVGWQTFSYFCPEPQTGSTLMMYTFGAEVEPVDIQVRFLDCCEGIEFYDLYLTLSDLSLCCGVTYDFAFYFTKAGFEFVKFTLDPLFELCCGISVGIEVEYGVDYKSVSPKFKWGGIEGCVTVWGDLQLKEPEEVGVEGWEFWGYKVYCELAECTFIEFVHAFDPYNVDLYYLGKAYKIDVFELDNDEDEYIKLGFCGPACCGGTWDVEVTIFQSTQQATLFGTTRILVGADVPIMQNLTLGFDWGYDLVDDETSFSVNWNFSF
jgi:hypothetical protein